MRIASTFPIAALTVWCAFASPASAAGEKYTYLSDTQYSGASDGASFGLATGVVVCEQKPRRPIVWFGAFKPLNGKSQFLYLLIFKSPADFDAGSFGMSYKGHGSSDTGAEGTATAQFGDKSFEVKYKFVTDPRTHALVKQSLAVGGREVKEGEPRVFVVDQTGKTVTYTPVKVELPKEAPDVSKPLLDPASRSDSDDWARPPRRRGTIEEGFTAIEGHAEAERQMTNSVHAARPSASAN